MFEFIGGVFFGALAAVAVSGFAAWRFWKRVW